MTTLEQLPPELSYVFTNEYWGDAQPQLPRPESHRTTSKERVQAQEAFCQLLPQIAAGQLVAQSLPTGTVFNPGHPQFKDAYYSYPGTVLLYDAESIWRRQETERPSVLDPTFVTLSSRGLLHQALEVRGPDTIIYHPPSLSYSNEEYTYKRRLGLMYIASNRRGEVIPIELSSSIYRANHPRPGKGIVVLTMQSRGTVGQTHRYGVDNEGLRRLTSLEICVAGKKALVKESLLGKIALKLKPQPSH